MPYAAYMSKILAVGSPKGGVGKTTTAVVLALIAAIFLRLRSELVDADANRSAYDWMIGADDELTPITIGAIAGSLTSQLGHVRKSRANDLTTVDLPGERTTGAWHGMLTAGGGSNGGSKKRVADFVLLLAGANLMDLTPVTRVLTDEVIPQKIPYLLVLTGVHPSAVGRARETAEQIRKVNGFNVANTLIRRYGAYEEARNNYRTILDWGGRHSRARNGEIDYLALALEVFPHLLPHDLSPISTRLQELTHHGA